MAPAAADLIVANFKDFETDEKYYDRIITGDLGTVGREILINLVKEKGYDISQIHMDCGIEIFDPQKQGTHAGGSGCGCSAVVFSSYIIDNVRDGKWKRILFIPTGALLSTVSYNEVPRHIHMGILSVATPIISPIARPSARPIPTLPPLLPSNIFLFLLSFIRRSPPLLPELFRLSSRGRCW